MITYYKYIRSTKYNKSLKVGEHIIEINETVLDQSNKRMKNRYVPLDRVEMKSVKQLSVSSI